MPLGTNTSNTTSSETTTQNPSVEVTEEIVTEEEVVNSNLPNITLIVEDGTGIPNANSYCDLDYALEYCTMKGYTDWQNLSEDMQKVYIIRGTEFVDNFYNWRGVRRKQSQSMAFPRDEIYDDDRYPVNGIPDKLKKACLEAAFLNVTAGTSTLFSKKDENGGIKKQKVDTLEIEYFGNQQNQDATSSQIDYTSIYDILNKLLKGLYITKGNNHVCTRAIYGW